MNNKLRIEAKIIFKKTFLELRNNAVYSKAMENIGKQRDITLVTADKRRSYLVSEPNYHTAKMVFRKFINNRNEQSKSKNKQANLSRSINIRH